MAETASSPWATASKPFAAVPKFVHDVFAHFPLHTYPPIVAKSSSNITRPTLWIVPPKSDIVLPSTNLLSHDVGCLKWQAYVALRGVVDVGVRWDVCAEGSIDNTLPSLQTPDGQLLGAKKIPAWVDERLAVEKSDPLEGYKDERARDESRAWVSLLEGPVHAALILYKQDPPLLSSLIQWSLPSTAPTSTYSIHLTPPPAPLSGLLSLFPPYGERISTTAIMQQYEEAIKSLSDRLGSDEWFLGSSAPTSLDALIFAYLHQLQDGPDDLRVQVSRRANLLAWERRVRVLVLKAYHAY